MCFPSKAPMKLGISQKSSKSLEISSQYDGQRGGLKNFVPNSSFIAVHVSLMILLTVVVPMRNAKLRDF